MAHNAFAEQAIKLKEMGYPQDLYKGDNVYLIRTSDYLQFSGAAIEDEHVKVPSVANLISNLADLNFELKHQFLGIENGEPKERWHVIDEEFSIQKESIWLALSQYWLMKKGNR